MLVLRDNISYEFWLHYTAKVKFDLLTDHVNIYMHPFPRNGVRKTKRTADKQWKCFLFCKVSPYFARHLL